MFVPIDRDEVVQIIKRYGPLLPLEVKRHLGKGDTTIVGATLSELAHHGKVKISKVKRGSSPFYYDPNNPASLEKVAKDLGEKDYRTFQLLKEKKVIRVDQVDPLTRVGLSMIKDYSIELKVEHQGETIIFYQYYLVSEEDARNKIQEILTGKVNVKQKEESFVEEKKISVPIVKSKSEDTNKNKSNKNTSNKDKTNENISNNDKPNKNKTILVNKNSVSTKPVIEDKKPVSVQKSELKKPIQKTLIKNIKSEVNVKNVSVSNVKDIANVKEVKNILETNDEFLKRLIRYFNKKNVTILTYEIIRKNSDIDFIIQVPTALGKVEYYCKAKSKKKSNDGDVASALLKGQQKRLLCIYLTTGEVTKKAKELTQTELKGVLIKEIP